jgi:hypothetical protein
MANEKYQAVGIIVPNIWKNIKKKSKLPTRE